MPSGGAKAAPIATLTKAEKDPWRMSTTLTVNSLASQEFLGPIPTNQKITLLVPFGGIGIYVIRCQFGFTIHFIYIRFKGDS